MKQKHLNKRISNYFLKNEFIILRFYDKRKEFDERFEKIFKLKEKGFKSDRIEFGKSALSNMLGGIGYFSGTSIHKYDNQIVRPFLKLFTSVPARYNFYFLFIFI